MTDILGSVQGVGGKLLGKGQSLLDNFFPPEKRAELMAKLQTFAATHPKLSAFLLCQFALTGFPLFMFVVFTITVFVFSLVAALLIGVLVALLFTVFMVGTALFVVLPVTFLTTMAATFVFLWGLGGYYLLKRFNKGDSSAAPGMAIGDKLNDLTGGRIGFLMDSARANEGNPSSGSDKADEKRSEKGTPRKLNGDRPSQNGNGSVPHASPGDVTDKVGKTVNASDVKKHANVDGVTKRASNVTNTAGAAKGALGGATGLT